MGNRFLRAIVILVALAAQAGAGYKVWELEERVNTERGSADTFERQARQISLGLADLRAAFHAYVADGQNGAAWRKTAADLLQAATSQTAILRAAARSPEGQGAIEHAVELLGTLGKTDVRAGDYLASAQRLSASDVVFAEAAPQAVRVADAVDLARGQETIARASAIESLRVTQMYWMAGAVAVTLVSLFLLFPVQRATDQDILATRDGDGEHLGSSLGISRALSTVRPAPVGGETAGADWSGLNERLASRPSDGAGPAPASDVKDCTAAADLCVSLARVKDPGEFPGLLARAADILGAVGIVIWMPDGPAGRLRPAVAHGYGPVAVTRMGTIATGADNATALAFRSQTAEVVAAEGDAGGAVVAPLVTADGCSGVMAAELGPGMTPTDHVRNLATIIAAQMATLLSPATPPREAV